MSVPAPAERESVRLLPIDLEVVLKLLPRAQIVVGDIPQILGSLQRLEAAARSKSTFVEESTGDAES
jgi:hypothetical protein